MKCKNFILVLFTVFLIVFNTLINAFAMNTGFSVSEMSSEDKQTFLSNVKLSLISEEPKKDTFSCFDVNNMGLIALGYDTIDENYISVYDANGKFQYGYTFSCDGSFGVQWNDKNLMVYFVRSDVAASFDKNGTNVEIKNIDDTDVNNSYWHNTVFSTEKNIDTNRYKIKNNMGLLNVLATDYSQLIKTDSDGNVTIIYDVSTAQLTKTVIIVTAVVLFVAFVIFSLVRQIFKKRVRT